MRRFFMIMLVLGVVGIASPVLSGLLGDVANVTVVGDINQPQFIIIDELYANKGIVNASDNDRFTFEVYADFYNGSTQDFIAGTGALDFGIEPDADADIRKGSTIGAKIFSPCYAVALRKSSEGISGQTEESKPESQPRSELPRCGEYRIAQKGSFYAKCVPTGVAVFRPSNRMWYYNTFERSPTGRWILDTRTNARRGPWGLRDDRPISGQFDRGALNDVAVFRPSTGMWYYDHNHNGTTDETSPRVGWGMSEEIPIAGDFDRDGSIDDVGTFRPSTRMWHYDFNHNGTSDARSGPWALRGDRPVVGDFDRDGRYDDVAVFRPSNHMWYYDLDHDGDTDYRRGPWGFAEDLPIAGDFDGDCRADDVAVFRPSNQRWYFDFDHDATTDTYQWNWGARGDIPIACHHP